MKILFLVLMISFKVLAFESYGIGKVVKVPNKDGEQRVYKYYLVVKQDQKVGAFAIKPNKQFPQKYIQSKVGQIVIFRGKFRSVDVRTNESTKKIEAIEFVKLKKITFKDINNAISESVKSDPKLQLQAPSLEVKRFEVSDGTTQKAILTSAALLLNDMSTTGSGTDDVNKKLTTGLILGSGVVMIADELKSLIKVKKEDKWHVERDQPLQLPLTQQD